MAEPYQQQSHYQTLRIEIDAASAEIKRASSAAWGGTASFVMTGGGAPSLLHTLADQNAGDE